MTVGVPGTVTVAVATLLVPPAPVQVNEYEFVAVSAPVPCVPLVALAPLQPPEAAQEVALVELHVSVEVPPLATEVGFAVSVTVGAGTRDGSRGDTAGAARTGAGQRIRSSVAVSAPVL